MIFGKHTDTAVSSAPEVVPTEEKGWPMRFRKMIAVGAVGLGSGFAQAGTAAASNGPEMIQKATCSCSNAGDCTCKKGTCKCSKCKGSHVTKVRLFETLKGSSGELKLPETARHEATGGVFI
jgi:hypothetical protein